MMFKNQQGEEVYLADNLTLKELAEMGMSIQLSEQNDMEHQIWQDEEEEVSAAEH
jgi:hypothetical protein